MLSNLFHQYLRPCHESGTILFRIPGAILIYDFNLTFLAQLPKELDYLSMQFIPEMVCTTCSADHLKNK